MVLFPSEAYCHPVWDFQLSLKPSTASPVVQKPSATTTPHSPWQLEFWTTTNKDQQRPSSFNYCMPIVHIMQRATATARTEQSSKERLISRHLQQPAFKLSWKQHYSLSLKLSCVCHVVFKFAVYAAKTLHCSLWSRLAWQNSYAEMRSANLWRTDITASF